MVDSKSDTVSGAAEDLKNKASGAAESAKAEAAGRAEGAKSSIADEISGVASAFKTASGEFEGGSTQSRAFNQFADGLNSASEALRQKDLGEVVTDLNTFARNNPLAFLGGAALLGFAATRFAKASERPAAPPSTPARPAASPPAATTTTTPNPEVRS